MGKNYVALLKPKSLFLFLVWCSHQMGKTVAALLVFLTRKILILSTTLFQPFSNLLWHTPCQVSGSYLITLRKEIAIKNEKVTKKV